MKIGNAKLLCRLAPRGLSYAITRFGSSDDAQHNFTMISLYRKLCMDLDEDWLSMYEFFQRKIVYSTERVLVNVSLDILYISICKNSR